MLHVFIAVHPFKVFTTKQPHRCSYFHTHSNNLQQKQFFCVCLLKVFFRNTFHQLDNQYVVKQQYILSWVSHSLVSEMKDLFALVRFCFKMKIILIYPGIFTAFQKRTVHTTQPKTHVTWPCFMQVQQLASFTQFVVAWFTLNGGTEISLVLLKMFNCFLKMNESLMGLERAHIT